MHILTNVNLKSFPLDSSHEEFFCLGSFDFGTESENDSKQFIDDYESNEYPVAADMKISRSQWV